MRSLFPVLALVTLVQPARAAVPFADVVRCRVQSVQGGLYSYLPPRVGDEITLDLRGESIGELRFDGRNVVPVMVPLRKTFHPDVAGTVFYFTSEQYVSHLEKGALTLAVGKGQDQYWAAIQTVTTDLASGLVSTDRADLRCRKLTP